MENQSQKNCQAELSAAGIIPRKYHGQVFSTDPKVIRTFIETVESVYRPGTKIVEIGGGLGYLTESLVEEFDNIDCLEIDPDLLAILNKKFIQNRKSILNKNSIHNRKKNFNLILESILDYTPPKEDYMLVGNIPFHLSGKLYRKFMSDEKHKPYAWVLITDKQYAKTLLGQPPRSYRVSLQAQAYGDLEIVADVPPAAVYPPPKVMMCILKILRNPTPLPQNFWKVVNYHFENFPTKEVESPKTMSLQEWIELAKQSE